MGHFVVEKEEEKSKSLIFSSFAFTLQPSPSVSLPSSSIPDGVVILLCVCCASLCASCVRSRALRLPASCSTSNMKLLIVSQEMSCLKATQVCLVYVLLFMYTCIFLAVEPFILPLFITNHGCRVCLKQSFTRPHPVQYCKEHGTPSGILISLLFYPSSLLVLAWYPD